MGIPDLYPNNLNIKHFNGVKNVINVNCNGFRSCYDTHIHINGSYINGIHVVSNGTQSFFDGILDCGLKSNEPCDLKCDDVSPNTCDLAKFVCQGGVCQCSGQTCPIIKTFTYSPTKNPTIPTMTPISNAPTSYHTIYICICIL